MRFAASTAATLVVEDSAHGLASAVAADLDCATVHNSFTEAQDFSPARHRIADFHELSTIVGGR